MTRKRSRVELERYRRSPRRREEWEDEDARPRGRSRGRDRISRLTYDPTVDPLWYGCCPPLFDMCSDGDIARLFYEDADEALQWLGMRPAEACRIVRNFIQYVAPAGAKAGTPASGIPSNICEPGAAYEWGTCDFELDGFGLLQNSAPVRKIGGTEIPYCVRQPRYRVDGTLIRNQDDWDMARLLEVTMQQIATRVLTGNKATTNDAHGLRQLVKNGYTNIDGTPCTLMDSFIVDWNGELMCDPAGADGVTINGVTLANGQSFYKVMRDVFYRIRRRVKLAGLPRVKPGDMAMLIPDWAIPCLIECAVCWIECSGDYTRLTSEAAAAKRAELMTGFAGGPMIEFDGFPVPLIEFNPVDYTNSNLLGLLDNSDGTFDAFMLTRRMGNNQVLTVEYNDLTNRYRDTNENGQFMVWTELDNRCEQWSMATEWRLYLDAPWAQVSILNVACDTTFPASIKPAATRATLNKKATNC